VLHKDKDSDYGVTIPDLPGCFSAGDTIEDAVKNAEEAILCHLEGMVEDGEDLPAPHPADAYAHVHTYDDGILAIVEVDLSKISGKCKRIDITLPQKIIRKIDREAKRRGLTRSAYILELALHKLSK